MVVFVNYFLVSFLFNIKEKEEDIMKETINNLKKVYQFGKDFKTSLFLATFFSFVFIIVNVVYPIFTAK